MTQTRTPVDTATPAPTRTYTAGYNNYAYYPTPCPTDATCRSRSVPAPDVGGKTVHYFQVAGAQNGKFICRGKYGQPGTETTLHTFTGTESWEFTKQCEETFIDTDSCTSSCKYNAWKLP